MTFYNIPCGTDIFVCTAGTACYNTLLNCKSAVYNLISERYLYGIVVKLFVAVYFYFVKNIVKICI